MPNGYMGNSDAAFFFKLMSDLAGLWMWGLCLWFFLVSIGAHWKVMRPNDPEHHIRFDMTWYFYLPQFQQNTYRQRFSFVFPNTALITATFALANSLGSHGMKVFGTVLSALLVIVWIFVFGMMVRAFILRRLLWPGEVDGAEVSRNKWAGKLGMTKNYDEPTIGTVETR
jgi:tellurite resistance protein TehA-like permease